MESKMKRGMVVLAILLGVFLPSVTRLLAQSPQTITAENASQLVPLLELNSPYVYTVGWRNNETVFVETDTGNSYYNITTGAAGTAAFSPSKTVFSPDGTMALVLVYGSPYSREHDFYIYDVQTGDLLVDKVAERGTYPYTDAVFTPDGTGIIFSYDDGIGHEGQIAYANVQGLLHGTADVEYLCTSNQPLVLSPFSQADTLVIAMGGMNGTVQIWQTDDIHRITSDAPLITVSSTTGYDMRSYMFSDPDTLVTREGLNGHQNLIRWWNINTGVMQRELLVDFGNSNGDIKLISPDASHLLVYQGEINELQLWNISHDTPTMFPLAGSLSGQDPMMFSPDSRRLAYIDTRGFLGWFDLSIREPHILGEFDREVLFPEFNNTHDLLLIHYSIQTAQVVFRRSLLELWNLPRREKIQSLYDVVGTFSPDGQTLVTGDINGIIHFIDAHTGEVKRIISDDRFSAPVTDIVFLSDGKTLVCGFANGSVYLIDLDASTIQNFLAGSTEPRYTMKVDLMLSPSGRLLVAQVNDLFSDIYLWNMNTRQIVLFYRGNFFSNGLMLFSPDEKRLAVAGGRRLGATTSGLIQVFDTRTGEVLTALGGSYLFGEMPDVTPTHCYPYARHSHIYNVYALGFHPKGDVLAAASGDNVALWDLPTAIEHKIGIDVCEVDGVNEMLYSFALPGRGSRGDATHSDNWSMTLHPTKPWLAFASRDGHVYLWDFSDPLDVQSKAIESESRTLAFSPDGRLLVTGGTTIGFWEVDTLTPIHNLPEYLVQSSGDVQFSPNGQYLLTNRAGGETLTIWGLP
jgi:WD40 repeat protein